MKQTKYKPCPICKTGRVMTDEGHRSFNGKVNGKQACPDCVVSNIYTKAGL